MTYREFQDYLESYSEALLKLIPVYHDTNFPPIYISSYIKKSPWEMKSLKRRIGYRKRKIKLLEAQLKSCKGKKKSKKKAGQLAKQLTININNLDYLNVQLSTLPLNVEQAKKFEKVSSNVLEELYTVIEVIDDVADDYNMLRFRYIFNGIQGDTDLKLEGGIDKRVGAIIIDFMRYLDRQSKNCKQASVRQKVIKKMEEQRNEYLQRYKKILKKLKTKKGILKIGGKQEYIPDKELTSLFKGILREFKGSSHTLTDIAEIAQKRIRAKYGLRKRKKDFKKVDYYSLSKLKMFLSKLRNTGQLR